ncbi:hypothetical protein MXD95_023470 [Frankia sp. AiPa1]|nr:hypothetical protein [Frankia sp. AiPa1]MCL9762153.1 hypothetical protein [Frankia sp. AiPa1]
MTLSGARPRGPKAELENKSQLALLQHLYELNQPYRVSYEMVVRKIWADSEDARIRRSRARDLSRQFRGDKQIDWSVIENYVELLYPDDHDQRCAQLDRCRPLHVEAFGLDPADDSGASAPAPSPEYVAELEGQLAEARMRASFATALLVIVRAENAALRGRTASFGWFAPRHPVVERTSGARDSSERTFTGRSSTGRDSAGRDSAGRDSAGRDSAGRGPVDPATAPIPRSPSPRSSPLHRRAGRPFAPRPDLPAEPPAPRSPGSLGWSRPAPRPAGATPRPYPSATYPTPLRSAAAYTRASFPVGAHAPAAHPATHVPASATGPDGSASRSDAGPGSSAGHFLTAAVAATSAAASKPATTSGRSAHTAPDGATSAGTRSARTRPASATPADATPARMTPHTASSQPFEAFEASQPFEAFEASGRARHGSSPGPGHSTSITTVARPAGSTSPSGRPAGDRFLNGEPDILAAGPARRRGR